MQPVWEWLSGYATRWHDLWEIVGALGSAAAAGVGSGSRHENEPTGKSPNTNVTARA